MKPKPIGIVGGAGPLAAVPLLEQIFCLARDVYGCWKDEDFPKVFVLSFPFSDMLSMRLDASRVRGELRACLQHLRAAGAEVIGIACNTLHAFLDEEESSDLVRLPQLVEEHVNPSRRAFVLATSTTARFNLYATCVTPDVKVQVVVDEIIEKILKGQDVLEQLLALIATREEEVVVLGCTELSLYTQKLLSLNKQLIDPLGLLAEKLIQKSFEGLSS